MVWARTKDADTLNWVVRPDQEQDPDAWTVLVLDGDAQVWEHYAATGSAFLADLLAGAVTSDILSSELTPEGHTFDPSPGS